MIRREPVSGVTVGSGMRWLVLVVVGACWLALGALALNLVTVPPAWNPWAPLSVDDPPTTLTRYKLARLSGDAAACRATLATSTLRYTPLPDRSTGAGCGFDDAVRIEAIGARVDPPFALSCRSAVALALWERHVVQPAASATFGQPVARLVDLGSYACRNVYGLPDARRSQHATADALDVAGFVLADGTQVRVASDWNGTGPRARFLHEVHDGACRFFDGVLGPDYNAAHHDHLHLDRGAFRVCR
jgi:hypothetical protein